MSERELVVSHLWGRVLKAFEAGNTDEAQKLVNFHDALDEMTDAGYAAIYSPEAVVA